MHVNASVIRKQMKDLAAGLDLDRRRLLEQAKPRDKLEALPKEMSRETLNRIKKATVQIGEINEKPKFSGVVVPDGFVLTCAHHHRLPGTKLHVQSVSYTHLTLPTIYSV